jgi:hypothetical protein
MSFKMNYKGVLSGRKMEPLKIAASFAQNISFRLRHLTRGESGGSIPGRIS